MSTERPAESRKIFTPLLTVRQLFTKRNILGTLLILAIVPALGLPRVIEGRRVEEEVPQPRALPVEAIRVERVESYRAYRDYTGQIVARRKSDLGFERRGKLVRVAAEEGQRVASGSVLAVQDTQQLEVFYRELQARKAQGAAKLQELVIGPRKETIAAARAQVKELRERLTLAKIRRSRRQKLLAKKVIAAEKLDEAVYDVKVLQAQLDAAQRKLEELLAGTREEQIRAQKALIRELDARIASVQIDLKKSVLRAPFTGRVSRRWVDEGTVVSAGQAILSLVESGLLEARVGIPVQSARNHEVGSDQHIRVGRASYRARVSALLPELDEKTRTVTMVLTVDPSAADKIFPGQVVRLRLAETLKTRGFWLPTAALTRGTRGLWSAYALVDASSQDRLRKNSPSRSRKVFRAERRQVEILHTESDRVLVRGTLRPGDLIVRAGTHRIVVGQLVRLTESQVARVSTEGQGD